MHQPLEHSINPEQSADETLDDPGLSCKPELICFAEDWHLQLIRKHSLLQICFLLEHEYYEYNKTARCVSALSRLFGFIMCFIISGAFDQSFSDPSSSSEVGNCTWAQLKRGGSAIESTRYSDPKAYHYSGTESAYDEQRDATHVRPIHVGGDLHVANR